MYKWFSLENHLYIFFVIYGYAKKERRLLSGSLIQIDRKPVSHSEQT